MRKKGVVIGLSGGLDSSVCAAICVNAIGKDKVLGLFMPERETKDDTNRLGSLIANYLEIDTITEDITFLLESAGCYARRDRAVRQIFDGYSEGWKCKVFLPPITENDRLNVSQLVVQSPEGTVHKKRMTTSAYLTIIASSNFKQRTRKMMEYYHADRLNYAVVGTPNRLEYELGFFVKNGDGAADLKPIAHLYKSQVYQLAEHYGVPEEIIQRTPTTDTFPMEQTQEEFYFSLPLRTMDLALFCYNNGYPPEKLSEMTDLTVDKARFVMKDIEQKKRSTSYLHLRPEIFGAIKLYEGPS
jgi:NAD+ synthase